MKYKSQVIKDKKEFSDLTELPRYATFAQGDYDLKQKTIETAFFMEYKPNTKKEKKLREWAFGKTEEGFEKRGLFCEKLGKSMTEEGLLGLMKITNENLGPYFERDYNLRRMVKYLQERIEEDPRFPYR